jgi:hypothetical protein
VLSRLTSEVENERPFSAREFIKKINDRNTFALVAEMPKNIYITYVAMLISLKRGIGESTFSENAMEFRQQEADAKRCD